MALIAVAFAFDGWLVAPSIAHEIKNPKRNLPLALMLAPILILVIYLAYFVGITSVLGSAKIIELGDSAVGEIANMFFGPLGIKIVYTCVVLSVLGTLNGLILGFIRLPYALALRNEMYQSEKLAKVHAKYDIPLASVVLSLVISLVWLLLHFLSTNGVIYYKLTLFEGLDVSELPIVLTYFFYMSIYVSVIRNFVINRAKRRSQRIVDSFNGSHRSFTCHLRRPYQSEIQCLSDCFIGWNRSRTLAKTEKKCLNKIKMKNGSK